MFYEILKNEISEATVTHLGRLLQTFLKTWDQMNSALFLWSLLLFNQDAEEPIKAKAPLLMMLPN